MGIHSVRTLGDGVPIVREDASMVLVFCSLVQIVYKREGGSIIPNKIAYILNGSPLNQMGSPTLVNISC